MQYFNIQMASQLSGVATATIRAWEKRYQAVTPKRAENKHRLYSEQDIEKLTLLSKLTDFGQNIGKIARLDFEELKKVYTVLMKRPYETEEIFLSQKEKINYPKTLSSLSLALSTLKMDVIAHELKKVRELSQAKDIALQFISPLQEMIRQKRHNQEMSETHIRVLIQIIKLAFSPILSDFDYPDHEPPLILATPEGQGQQLGILGAALLCAHYQRNFIYLGTSLSAKELAESIHKLKSEVIVLETNSYQLNSRVNLDQYLDELSRLLQHDIRIHLSAPAVLEHHIRRKNCHFIHELKEFDEKLASSSL